MEILHNFLMQPHEKVYAL